MDFGFLDFFLNFFFFDFKVLTTVAHKGKTQLNIELDTQRFFVIQNNFRRCTTIFRDTIVSRGTGYESRQSSKTDVFVSIFA